MSSGPIVSPATACTPQDVGLERLDPNSHASAIADAHPQPVRQFHATHSTALSSERTCSTRLLDR